MIEQQQKCVFVRALWGDEHSDHPPRVYDDIRDVVQYKRHPEPVVTYVYGTHNQEFLQSLGIESILVCPDGIKNYGAELLRNVHGEHGEISWGVNMFAQKLEVLKIALETYDQICFLDWDTWLVKPTLPEDFWDRMNQGQELQVSMYAARRGHFFWRTGGRGHSMQASFIYCRSLYIARQLFLLQMMCPERFEEDIMAMWAELHYAEWNDYMPDRWIKDGFQPYCNVHKKTIRQPIDLVFKHR